MPDQFDNGIDDDTFAKIVACIRIAVPYTGMIISTRESQKCRERVLHLGISQISGGSRTSVGGYCEPEPEDAKSEQFDVSDTRTLDEVVRWLMEMDYIPKLLYRLLPGRPHRRPFYVSLQKRTDPELLPSECTHDTEGISDGLCFSGDKSHWRPPDRQRSVKCTK